MNFDKAIDKISASVPKPIAETYKGDDGLLRCSKCDGKRETIVTVFGKERKVNCICTCQKEALEAEELEQKNHEKMRRIEELRKTGFHDRRLEEWTFYNDDGSHAEIMKAARNYVDKFDTFKRDGKGLLLFGNVGTGKTYVAASIANALVDKGVPVLMTNFSRIANKLQETFDGKQAYLDALNKFDLLVIDDLAAERKTEYMQEIVFNVVDSRYRSGLPMIITTNLGMEAFRKPATTMESRIYDRILENCLPLEVKGKSNRKKSLKDDYADMKGLLGLN